MSRMNYISKSSLAKIGVFIAFAVLIALGSWQMFRLAKKEKLIETMNLYVALPALQEPLPHFHNEPYYRKIEIQGQFLHDKEIHLFTGPRQMHGKPGYHILTPFRSTQGTLWIVDRGWVPISKREATKRGSGQIEGQITLEGLLLPPEKKGYFTPDNNTTKNVWFWVDFDAIKQLLQEDLVPYIFQLSLTLPEKGLSDKEKKDLPFAITTLPTVRNHHLYYAITWYALALALVLLYYVRFKPKDIEHRE